MRLDELMRLPDVFRDIAICFVDFQVWISCSCSGHQSFSHDSHERGISVVPAFFQLGYVNQAIMDFLVAGFAERNQIIWSVASGFSGL